MEARQNCWRFVQTCPSMEKFPPSFKSQPYGDCFVILASCDSVTIHVVKNPPSKKHSKTITNHHITKFCQSASNFRKSQLRLVWKKTNSPTGFLLLPHFLEQKQTSLGFSTSFFWQPTKRDSNPGIRHQSRPPEACSVSARDDVIIVFSGELTEVSRVGELTQGFVAPFSWVVNTCVYTPEN